MPPKKKTAAPGGKGEPLRRGRSAVAAVEVEVEGEPEDAAEEEAITTIVVQPVAEEEATSPVKRGRGRPSRRQAATSASASVVEVEEIVDGIDLDDLLASEGLETPPTKKRGRPSKSSSSAKKSAKLDQSGADFGGAGDGENLLQCDLCDARVVQLVRHIRAQHGDDENYDAKIKEARVLEAKAQTTSPRKQGGASNLIEELNASVAKMDHAKSEMTARTPGGGLVRPKNTQCPICDKVVRRYDLNKHIRNVHSGEKPNKCPYCDYASPWKGNLNTHIAGIHTKARLHDCVRCGLSFKTRSAMIGHVRKVHDKMYQPKERLFECVECDKKFYKKFHLQRHIRVHTGEKPFTCAFCEKPFASKTNMDSHIQAVHLKIKPFKCGYCEKGFARKKLMLVHIRKAHMPNRLDVDEPMEGENVSIQQVAMIMDGDMQDMEGMGQASDGEMEEDLEGEDLEGAIEGEEHAETGSDKESVTSGELISNSRGEQMVLMKLKNDEGVESGDEGGKYMLVNADTLPSDIDTTLDTTVDRSIPYKPADDADAAAADGPADAAADDAADAAEPNVAEEAQAVEAEGKENQVGEAAQATVDEEDGDITQAVIDDEAEREEKAPETTDDTTAEAPIDEPATKTVSAPVEGAAETIQEHAPVPPVAAPIVISVDASHHVVQAVQTTVGLVLVTQTVPTTTEAEKPSVDINGAQPDLIQQAVDQAIPEVAEAPTEASPTKAVEDEGVTSTLPANILATEETAEAGAENGIASTGFEFLKNMDSGK